MTDRNTLIGPIAEALMPKRPLKRSEKLRKNIEHHVSEAVKNAMELGANHSLECTKNEHYDCIKLEIIYHKRPVEGVTN